MTTGADAPPRAAVPDAGGRPDETVVRKARLRDEMRARLARLTPEAARHAAELATERLFALPELAGARSALTCLSFGSELDTWALVEKLLASGREVYVPRADPRDRRLHVHRYPCALRTVSFGLRQPPRGTPELDTERIGERIDLVLVLGLAFDRRGYRLGHGSGYFDRFLARHALRAVGLAFDLQLLDELPRAPHDVPMKVVVTDREIWRPPGG